MGWDIVGYWTLHEAYCLWLGYYFQVIIYTHEDEVIWRWRASQTGIRTQYHPVNGRTMLPTELMRLAAHPKVKTNHLQKSRVIRLVICIDCQKHYIGETATPSTPYNRLKLVRIYWALFVGQLCHKWTSIHLCCFLSVLACIKVKLITLIYPSIFAIFS